jgi:polyferredoxin
MVLDLLPYAESGRRVNRGWEKLRYLHFALSASLVAGLFFIGGYRCESGSADELWWLVSGNTLYYGSAVILAWVLGDNRAFCKYLCPVAPVLKLGARFSLLKVSGSRRSCTLCGRCAQHCPMNIRVFEYVRRGTRVLSTECILCLECLHACPTDSLEVTFGFDLGGREYIKRRQ